MWGSLLFKESLWKKRNGLDGVMLRFRFPSPLFLIGYRFVPYNNLQNLWHLFSGFPSHKIFDCIHSNLLGFEIIEAPTLFQADSVTLDSHHTTGQSDKIICRTNKIIETLPRIGGRGELGPNWAQLSCIVLVPLVV